jgi:hypothetical protein
MATGYYDANGIWMYGEDDALSPHSTFMNLGQASVSTEVGLLQAATTEVPISIGYATDWRAPTTISATPPTMVQIGNRVKLLVGAVENSATVSFATAGQDDGWTIPVGSRPLTTIILPAMVGVTGTLLSAAQILIRPTGVVTLQTVDAFTSAPAGTVLFSFGSAQWEV